MDQNNVEWIHQSGCKRGCTDQYTYTWKDTDHLYWYSHHYFFGNEASYWKYPSDDGIQKISATGVLEHLS